MIKIENINRSNYEQYVIDYLEGKLSEPDRTIFELFLTKNPDLKDEIEDLEQAVLTPSQEIYASKSSLKKKSIAAVNSINEDNYEEFFIGSLEGDLSNNEKDDLDKFLKKNSELLSEFKLFQQLRLTPDTSIKLSNKNSLKKRKHILPVWVTSAAAVVLLLISIWYIGNNQVSNANIRSNILLSSIDTRTILLEMPSTNKYFVPENRDLVEVELPKNEISRIDTKVSALESRSAYNNFVNVDDFKRLIPKSYNDQLIAKSETTRKNNVIDDSKNNQKSLIAAVFTKQWKRLKTAIVPSNNKIKSNDPTYVKLLDGSLYVFNTITGSDKHTSKVYNQNGDLISYQIEGREVLLNRNSAISSAN